MGSSQAQKLSQEQSQAVWEPEETSAPSSPHRKKLKAIEDKALSECPMAPAVSLKSLEEGYDTLNISVNQVQAVMKDCKDRDLMQDDGDGNILTIMYERLLPKIKEGKSLLNQQEEILFSLADEAGNSTEDLQSLIKQGEVYINDFQKKMQDTRKLSPKAKATSKIKSEKRKADTFE